MDLERQIEMDSDPKRDRLWEEQDEVGKFGIEVGGKRGRQSERLKHDTA